jgi:hypothetical protein
VVGLKGVSLRDRERSEERNLFVVNKMKDDIMEFQEEWRKSCSLVVRL